MRVINLANNRSRSRKHQPHVRKREILRRLKRVPLEILKGMAGTTRAVTAGRDAEVEYARASGA